MNHNNYFKYYFILALGILNTICIMLVFSALTFLFNLSLSWLHFPLSICGSIFINYFASKYYFVKEYKLIFYKSTVIILIVVLFSILLGKSIYDISWDGQGYHQETIIQLKEGWNPFYSQLNFIDSYVSLLSNHYGKGAEIPQATIYAFTNKIQAGKATNILLLLASYFLCGYILSGIKKLSTFKIHLISSLFALNPITTNQIFTYYIDGQVGSLLCGLLIISYLLYNDFDKYKLLLFSSIVIILVNIKFTCVIFASIFISGLLIALFYNNKKIIFKKVFIAAFLSLIMGICFVGYNPYITNTINHGNPFYPLLGKEKLDIMTDKYPKGFNDKNRFEKFAISILSRPDNTLKFKNSSPEIKIPFMFNKDDIYNSSGYDMRIGGFGFLFEEIMLLAIGIFCSILIFNWDEFGPCLTYIIVVLLFSVFIISEAWWARYVPQFWLVCLIIVIVAELSKYNIIKKIGCVLLTITTVNAYFVMTLIFMHNVRDTVNIEYQLAQIKLVNKTVIVKYGEFKSIRKRFIEKGINYVEENISIGNNVVTVEGSCGGALVKFVDIPENVPKPFLMRCIYILKGLHIFK